MVRFKVRSHPLLLLAVITRSAVCEQNRWLLVELLPVPVPTPGRASALQPQDELTSKQIWAALKQSVITHFGDTGWGAVGSSLTSTSYRYILASQCLSPSDRCAISQVLLAPDESVHHTRRARPTQDCVGERCAHDRHRRAEVHSAHRPCLRYVWSTTEGAASRAQKLRSGTIKQAQLAAIRHNREIVARYRARAKLPGMCIML